MGQISEGGSNARVVGNEVTVVITQPQEGLEFFEVGWSGPVPNGFHFLGVGGDSFSRDDVSQVFDRVLEEFTLGGAAIESVFAEDFKDLLDVVFVVLFILTVDQD